MIRHRSDTFQCGVQISDGAESGALTSDEEMKIISQSLLRAIATPRMLPSG